MKKGIGSITLLVIALLLTSLAVECIEKEETKQKQKWHGDKEGGYKIKYPFNWGVKEEKIYKESPWAFGCIVFFGNESGKFLNFTIIYSVFPEGTIGGKLGTGHIPEVPLSIEITNITLDGIPATKEIITYKDGWKLMKIEPPLPEKIDATY